MRDSEKHREEVRVTRERHERDVGDQSVVPARLTARTKNKLSDRHEQDGERIAPRFSCVGVLRRMNARTAAATTPARRVKSTETRK